MFMCINWIFNRQINVYYVRTRLYFLGHSEPTYKLAHRGVSRSGRLLCIAVHFTRILASSSRDLSEAASLRCYSFASNIYYWVGARGEYARSFSASLPSRFPVSHDLQTMPAHFLRISTSPVHSDEATWLFRWCLIKINISFQCIVILINMLIFH